MACVKDDESSAVEAGQAFLGRQPQVSIPGLDDLLHGVLREPVVLHPDVMDILRRLPGRIEPRHLVDAEQQDQDAQGAAENDLDGHPAPSCT